MVLDQGHGIVSKPSLHSVDQTLQKPTEILKAKGVKLFALVDHSGEAENAGLHMRPTKLLSSAIRKPERRSCLSNVLDSSGRAPGTLVLSPIAGDFA
jgi:hypothetical protein